jgi:hypothetical protein
MNRLRFFLSGAVSGILLFSGDARAAERFGNILVAPQSLVSGSTYHGYREFRILLENESPKETHRVTLVMPDHPYVYGNSLSRVSRTVTLGPSARVIVPLWQPPLPANGNGLLRVEIDYEAPVTVSMPGASGHVSSSGPRYSGSPAPPAILVSRDLNYDGIARTLKAERSSYTASMALGSPDSGGRRGMIPTAWMPDVSSSGPHWLELQYDSPIRADRVEIHSTMTLPGGGEAILIGASGTNLARVPLSTPGPAPAPVRRPGRSAASGGFATTVDYSFPLTSEPVKTVRLDFGSGYAGAISIDAVELSGPSEASGARLATWASSARASSEANLTSPGIPGMEARELLRAELPVSDWSEYWLSYTPFDAIALSASDVQTMPAAVLNTLWRYTESGGNLFIFGSNEVPEPWRSAPKETIEGAQCINAAFGKCFVIPGDKAGIDLNPSIAREMVEAATATARIWQSIPDETTANAAFPVVANVKIPVRGIVFIMLAFVIIIGPINMITLSRMNRRTWLLWTIPAISVATSLIVFIYSLFHEGITPDTRTESLTFLDQVNRRATSLGTTAFYCPLTPSQGLFFGTETEATPLVETGNYRSGAPREMDWTEGQHLRRGWVTARVSAHFQLRKSETRRERLQWEGAGDRGAVVNGLGAPIRSLWLADESGRLFAAFNIGAGQKANLTALSIPKIPMRSGVRPLLGEVGFTPFERFSTTNAPAYLSPNTYIADLETNPFLENGLGPKAKSSRTRSRALVYGTLEPSETSAAPLK